MKHILSILMTSGLLVWAGAATASSSASDVSSTLEDNHVDIRSLVDPGVTVLDSQPISVALPDNASIADKQLLELLKVNLVAKGFDITTPDKAKWVIVASVNDQSTLLSFSDRGLLSRSYTAEAAPVDYAMVTVIVCPSGTPNLPVWTSTVRAYRDFWVRNQEVIVAGILATYGRNFYYRDGRPVKIPDEVQSNDSQPPTVEQIKACLAKPDGKGCEKILEGD